MFDDRDEGDVSVKVFDGRIRSFPHVRGNWATYVFIPILLVNYEELGLVQFAAFIQDYFSDKDFVFHQLSAEELHISISRTVPLLFHWIDPIMIVLKEKISKYQIFSVGLSNLAYYTNDDKTRSFIGFKVDRGHNQLCALAEEVNESFSQYQLPKFYDNPSFHVSLYWCVGNLLPIISEDIEVKLQEQWNAVVSGNFHAVEYTVTDIQCKCGNKLFNFELS